jgi:hypothetical protein
VTKPRLYYGRWSVSQPDLVSGTHLGPATNFTSSLIIFWQLRICLCGAPSLTRSWICSFQLLMGIASAAFLRRPWQYTRIYIYIYNSGADHYSRGHMIVSLHFMEPEGSYPIHKSSPPVPILSQTIPVHIIPSHLSKIHPNTGCGKLATFFIWQLPHNYVLVFLAVSFTLAFLLITYTYSSSSAIHAIFPAHLILLDLIILIILGEKYKSRISSLFSFLHSPVILSLFRRNILFSNTSVYYYRDLHPVARNIKL